MNSLPSGISVLDKVILNNPQKDAVACESWPQLVFAGAGSGKTRVLTAKIAYLIQENQVSPRNIFAATFTNKAAREMRSRVESLIGVSCSGLWIGTFHSMCARILRQQARYLGFSATFTIYDKDDQLSQIKKITRALEIDERTIQPRHVAGRISSFKNRCLAPGEVDMNGKGMYDREILRVYEAYQKELKNQNAMDFDDLITNTVFLLRKNHEVLKAYQNLFKYILVDEYQDTNASQFELVKLLAQSHGHLFAVGDDDQSIYGWRGAQIENILCFEEQFPTAQVYKLEENYRSTPAVLDFANAVIRGNTNRTKKELWTSRPQKHEVGVTRYTDNRQEAAGVAEKIQELRNNGLNLSDTAVLFRTNAQSRSFEDVFRRSRIPYVLVGGMSFYERKEIKDCLAYLRLLVNPKDNISCDRIINVPARGIGAKSRAGIVELARNRGQSVLELILEGDTASLSGRCRSGLEDLSTSFSLLIDLNEQKTPPDRILNEMLTVTGYVEALEADDSEESDARLENINEMVNMLTIWSSENEEGTLAQFLEEVTLATDVDRWKQEDQAVNLMTLHCAKGLEFDAVFLVGLEDGLLPSRQNFDDECKLEEECRLLYVGATRSRGILECSYVDQRWRFGSVMPMAPSRFLKAVPDNAFTFTDKSIVTAPSIAPRPQSARQQQPRRKAFSETPPRSQFDEFNQDVVQYRMGQHVTHAKYGQGKILSISGFGPDMRLTILFADGSRKKMMAKFANLESS